MRRGQDYQSPATVKFKVFSVGDSTLDHPWWNRRTYNIFSGGPHLGPFVTFLIRHEENVLLAIVVDFYSSGI
jgi:hypothetical protein